MHVIHHFHSSHFAKTSRCLNLYAIHTISCAHHAANFLSTSTIGTISATQKHKT